MEYCPILLLNNAIFQDNVLIHTARKVNLYSKQHKNKLEHLFWPAQLPDLKYYLTTMGSFGKESEKQISFSNISEAIATYYNKRMGKYSTVGYSKFIA